MADRKCARPGCENNVPVDGDVCGLCVLKVYTHSRQAERRIAGRTYDRTEVVLVILAWAVLIFAVAGLIGAVYLWRLKL